MKKNKKFLERVTALGSRYVSPESDEQLLSWSPDFPVALDEKRSTAEAVWHDLWEEGWEPSVFKKPRRDSWKYVLEIWSPASGRRRFQTDSEEKFYWLISKVRNFKYKIAMVRLPRDDPWYTTDLDLWLDCDHIKCWSGCFSLDRKIQEVVDEKKEYPYKLVISQKKPYGILFFKKEKKEIRMTKKEIRHISLVKEEEDGEICFYF